ncbi:MAG: DUF4185 domain-containing protein [Planctomycetaceae bacterium]|nr:DUF4185 domain-containing protein [Planctomycetaceae bacterium]
MANAHNGHLFSLFPGLAFVAALLLPGLDAADVAPVPLRVNRSVPDDVMNRNFDRTDGWIGADAIYSVPLPDRSVLWIFGDTLVGQIRDGKRRNLTMVNNSFAKQSGWGSELTVQLFVNEDAQGKPTSFIAPEDKPGYFWLWDAIVEQGKLYIFATRLTSPGTITAFDWKLLDQSLIVVDNPLDEPAKWTARQFDFPFGAFTDSYEVIWGIEVLNVDDHIYVYGSAQHQRGGVRSLVVARVPRDQITDFDRWTFYRNGEWQNDSKSASSLTDQIGTEGSVTYLPDRRKFIYVYSPPLNPTIMMRTASTPIGPWSEAVAIYECPEVNWDSRIFCYAGKARLIPGTQNELLITYATNSFDMLPHVTSDARVYYPRFVRATLTD